MTDPNLETFISGVRFKNKLQFKLNGCHRDIEQKK